MTAEPLVVNLRVADMEPVKSFVADVGGVLGAFSTVGAEELAACPAAVPIGIGRLRAALTALAGEDPRRVEPRGWAIIEWPAPCGIVPGTLMAAFEIDPLGKPRPLYATRITIHAVPDGIVAAEVTAVVDDDGQPIAEGTVPITVNGELPVRTFWYEVAEMRTREASLGS